MSGSIYLDHAAATPLDRAAIRAMEPYLVDRFYNPSAAYQAAREVRRDLESAREVVARVMGARSSEIVFVAGGTEANNLAVHGIMRQFPDGNIVVSAIEHESVLEPARQYDHKVVAVDSSGLIDIASLAEAIDDKTVLVSIMYANNEIGTIQPLKDVSQLIEEMRLKRSSDRPLYLHTDSCQATNYLDMDVRRLGVDLMTINGGKIYAPKQSGALYVSRSVSLQPQIVGGGQESGVRSGTENVAALIAFATMLQKVQNKKKPEILRLQQISRDFIATLSQNISNIMINGHPKKRLPNNINFTIPGCDGERLLMELDEVGVMVATGSACAASNDQPSHVLRAIGLTDEQASASLRVSFGRLTDEVSSKEAARRIIDTIKKNKLV